MAEALFRKLGYRKTKDNEYVREYFKKNSEDEFDWSVRIVFCKANKEVMIEYKEDDNYVDICLTLKELMAIHAQISEFGWEANVA